MTENAPQKIRIHILDDEIVTVRRLVQALAKDGYEVEGFVSAAEAMARFSESPADILVTDVRLNDADGLDILQRVIALAPATKVILMTGYASVDHAVRAMKAGAYHYLAKPFRLEELRNTVRDALQDAGVPGRLDQESGFSDRFAGIIGRSPAMRGAPSRVCWRRPTVAPSSSMRSARCPSPCRSSCCGSSRSGPCCGWAGSPR